MEAFASMAAVLVVAGVEAESIRRDYLLIKALLENIGTETITPGTVTAKQTAEDGSFRSVEFFNSISLAPAIKPKFASCCVVASKRLSSKPTNRLTEKTSPSRA
jgi:hypothetical protein